MTHDQNIEYRIKSPVPGLSDFVENIWMLHNLADERKEVVLLPDGRLDMLFTISSVQPFSAMLMPLDLEASRGFLEPGMLICGVGFKLPAAEFLLEPVFSYRPGQFISLPEKVWNIGAEDLKDFDVFAEKCIAVMTGLLKNTSVPIQTKTLFDLIYSTNGDMPVQELSERSFWNSRQINRYFNRHFGLSLKAYCTILRFRASFKHLSEGKLFPEENFSDQNHFIKEVRKFAGVAPGELSKNEGGRFLQILAAGKPRF